MSKKIGKKSAGTSTTPRISMVISFVVNIALVAGLITCLILYIDLNKDSAYEQNIKNITSISRSKSIQAKTLLDIYSVSIEYIYNYCAGKTVGETLEYIDEVYSSTGEEFQLVRYTKTTGTTIVYEGYASPKNDSGDYEPVTYQSAGYTELIYAFEEIEVMGKIRYTNTFTNQTDGIKSFSPYCGIMLKDAGVEYMYVLLNPQTGSSLIQKMEVPSQYTSTTTAIFTADGYYLAYEPGYKSLNFYDYIYNFNHLSLDERNSIMKEVQNSPEGTGVLEYMDSRGRDCTFVYSKLVATSDWYVTVCVLNDDFVQENSIGTYPISIMLILIALLVYDSVLLLGIIKKLRLSVANERVANEAKTNFLSRMSHDIRTPMNGIMGLTELTLELKDLPEEARTNLMNVSRSNKYLLSIINDILDMNVIASGKMELHEDNADMLDIIANISQLSHASIVDKSIRFVLQKQIPEDEIVLLDKVRVQQVFMNIISNAIKYSHVGGRIDFICNCEKIENGRIYYSFIVKDNGIGMSEEFVRKVFEPFSREYNSMTTKYTGTGLGMAIVKTLVELMHGDIVITSQKDVGTEVRIDLNFKLADTLTMSSKSIDADYSILKGRRVLLVDDHPINITIAKKMLEMYGVIVEVAENGEVAIEKFVNSTENYYDAIFMDVMMPVMDGIEATKRIRKMERIDAQLIPIIAMTANAFAEDIISTKNAGMNAHLAKPIDKEALLNELCKQIKRKIANDR